MNRMLRKPVLICIGLAGKKTRPVIVLNTARTNETTPTDLMLLTLGDIDPSLFVVNNYDTSSDTPTNFLSPQISAVEILSGFHTA